MYHDLAVFFTWSFLVYFLAYHSFNFLLLVLAFFDVRRGLWLRGLDAPDLLLKSPYTPPLSILVPAYNEAVTIGASLRSLMALRLPRFEIIVVNDGSKDKTLEVLQESLQFRQCRPRSSFEIDFGSKIDKKLKFSFAEMRVCALPVAAAENFHRGGRCTIGYHVRSFSPVA